jgi:DNA-binding HxlR family transcriptional regulator
METRNLRPARSGCPIATTLDLVGDRWSFVIVRDMLNGKRRFAEFLDSLEKITTSVLADRLARLESAGLVEKQAYQVSPVRHEYRLTEKGAALRPVLQEICRWANRFLPGTWIPPEAFMARQPDSP